MAQANEVDVFELPGVLRDFGIQRLGEMVNWLPGDKLQDAPLGKYDLIVALDVLEHIHPDEFQGVMDTITKAMNPGGALYAHNNWTDGHLYPMHFDNSAAYEVWKVEREKVAHLNGHSNGVEKLPYEDYQKLRGWIENKDRERFSGYLDKGIREARNKVERSKTSEDLKAAEGGRVIDPVQQEVMRNPVVGLFMQGAAIANMVVASIRLDDSNRDYTKEQRDGLEEAKKNLDEKEKDRKQWTWEKPWDMLKSQEERDREQRDKIEKAIEENEKRKEKEKKKERERNQEKDRSPFERDPWGRW